MNKKYSAILLFIFFIIGLIHSLIESWVNIFVSWFLMGVWLILTITLFQKIKYYRQFNSPHNNSFFLFVPAIIGNLFAVWGYFTPFLQEDLFGGLGLYFSLWNLFFSVPYLLYSFFSLLNCYRKFDIVYIYKEKSVKSSKFAIGFSIIIIIFDIVNLIYVGYYWDSDLLTKVHSTPDLTLLLNFFFLLLLLIRYGIFGGRRATEISPELIAQRRRAIERINQRSQRAISTPTTRRQPTRTQRVSSRPVSSTRSRATSRTTSSQVKAKPKTTPTKRVRTTSTINFKKFKPKTSVLTEDDFKCIFCFSTPDKSKDKGRSIIVCPTCRYPAHADEWKDWLRSSNLCSRCSTEIPASYRRNPDQISVKDYEKVIKMYLKK